MQKRQRRKGSEYSFKDPLPRPLLHGEEELTAPAGGGERELGGLGSGPKGAVASPAPPASLSLSDYDPKVAAVKEHDVLLGQVTALRAESSSLQHAVHQAQSQLEEMRTALLQLSHEDEIEQEQAAGAAVVASEAAATRTIEDSLRDTLAYQRTLTFMHARGASERLTRQATLRSFEDAVRVYRRELELRRSLLRTALKSRDSEVAEVHRTRSSVAGHLGALDSKLEARRIEVTSRQDSARRRLVKQQVRSRQAGEGRE